MSEDLDRRLEEIRELRAIQRPAFDPTRADPECAAQVTIPLAVETVSSQGLKQILSEVSLYWILAQVAAGVVGETQLPDPGALAISVRQLGEEASAQLLDVGPPQDAASSPSGLGRVCAVDLPDDLYTCVPPWHGEPETVDSVAIIATTTTTPPPSSSTSGAYEDNSIWGSTTTTTTTTPDPSDGFRESPYLA